MNTPLPSAALSVYVPQRAFGVHGGDLELDLAGSDRALRATGILCACLADAQGAPPAEAEAWGWTLHRRLQALILIERTGQAGPLTLRAVCGDARCGEAMDLELDLATFVLPDAPSTLDVELAPGIRARVRLPSGEDQRRWLAAGERPGDRLERRLATELVESLNGEPPPADYLLPEPWLPALAEMLERSDPLTALRLDARCPACGRVTAVDVDLEAFLLQQASARQKDLLDAVHSLASAYHWSEREILALPRGRREQYLARVRESGAS